VILDDSAEQYLATNTAGSSLWKSLKDGASRDQLVGVLVETYKISRDQAQTDVNAFLAQLIELGLVVESPSGQGPGDSRDAKGSTK
jgi:hypothetical protein